ncbi:hypothetical protein GCM10009844_31070 [Nocardioides koreensis]|uniref:NERD domain-containing protein n=1 Tax=Nocardioides koreensis TaxID=433651 RepID=A0ABN2ZYZ5_9ACTN
MTKFQPYSRREFQRRFVVWAKRNTTLLVIVTCGMVGIVSFVTWVIAFWLPTTAFTWWLLGIVQASMVGIYLHLLHAAFLAHDGEAIWHLRGAWGEDNTRSELQRAKRKQLIWGWIDSINLLAGDLDHLVVTRNGGLVAIDSKWRNRASDTADMARAASKAKLRAEALTRTLWKRDKGAHRARVDSLPVTSIVVLWGAAQHGVPDGATVNGIEFIAGRRLIAWLSKLEDQPVTRAAAAEIVERLEGYRAATWDPTKAVSR